MYLRGIVTNEFDGWIWAAAAYYGVPESWIRAVIQTESSWNPWAYRAEPRINDASYGLMQLLLGTARGLGYQGTAAGLYDPETNIDLGTRLLADLRARYGDDFRRVYSAYNSGSPTKWETSSQVATHVSRALANLAQFVEETAAAAQTTAVQTVQVASQAVQESQGAAWALVAVGAVLMAAKSKKRR